MNATNCRVRFDFVATACHGYPIIKIDVNGNTLFQNELQETCTVEVDFDLSASNTLTVALINKQNGPDVYDTVIDAQGNIIEDKTCKIVDIYINKAKASFLLHDLIYEYADGSSEFIYGYLSQNGKYTIQFPEKVFDWIIDKRRALIPKRSTQSSLSYDSLFYMEDDYTQVNQLIKDCKNILENF